MWLAFVFMTSMACVLPLGAGLCKLALVVLALCIVISIWLCIKGQIHLWHVAVVLLVGCLRGYMVSPAALHSQSHSQQPVSAVLNGTVTQIFRVRTHYKQFIFKTSAGNLLARWYFAPSWLTVGDKWRLPLKLTYPRPPLNPGGYNKLYYLQAQGLAASAVVTSARHIYLGHQRGFSINLMRQHLAQHILQSVANKDLAAVLIALTTGSRAWLSQTAWQVFKNTGTSHLIAISGLHIGLVFVGVLFFINRMLAMLGQVFCLIPRQRLATVVALVAASAYAVLAGWSWSTQRASWMLILAVLAINCLRRVSGIRSLMFAVVVSCSIQPWALTQVGFWLSVLSVASILHVAPKIVNKTRWQQALIIQAVVFVALFPFVIYFFQYITWLSWPANALAIPWVSWLVVPLALFGVIICPFSMLLGGYCWKAAAFILLPLWYYLQHLAGFSVWIWHMTIANTWALLAVIVFCASLLLPLAILWRIILSYCFLPVVFASGARLSAGDWSITIPATKRAYLAVIQTSSHSLIVNDHMRSSRFLPTNSFVLLPLLWRLKLQNVDGLLFMGRNRAGAMRQWQLQYAKVNSVSLYKSDWMRPLATVNAKAWVWDGVHFSFYGAGKSQVLEVDNGLQHLKLNLQAGNGSESAICRQHICINILRLPLRAENSSTAARHGRKTWYTMLGVVSGQNKHRYNSDVNGLIIVDCFRQAGYMIHTSK